MNKLLVLLLCLLGTSVIASSPSRTYNFRKRQNEDQIIKQIDDLFRNSMNLQSTSSFPSWLRQAHAKQHGCVRGYLHVEGGLPSEYQQGVFANQTAAYPVFVRYSNGVGRGFFPSFNNNQSDLVPDTRGMAVKLMQVPGVKFLQPNAETQDFLMTTSETAFLPDAQTSLGFFNAVQGGKGALASFLLTHPQVAVDLTQTGLAGEVSDLLASTFWTSVPYMWGDTPAKFNMVPVSCPVETKVPEGKFGPFGKRADKKQIIDPNYLRTHLQNEITNSYYCYNMSVQLYIDDDRTPVEDSTIPWDSPLVTVGTLELFPQYVWSRGQDNFCRFLQFNPWNGIEAHEPLGIIQRIKKVVYTNMAIQRHNMRSQSNVEVSMEDWNNFANL